MDIGTYFMIISRGLGLMVPWWTQPKYGVIGQGSHQLSVTLTSLDRARDRSGQHDGCGLGPIPHTGERAGD